MENLIPPPHDFNFAQHIFELNARHPDKLAYIDDHSSITYAELEEQSRQFASGLRKMGIRREERILMPMHDCKEWPIAFLGCLYAGVVPICINTLLKPETYTYMLNHSRATAIFTSSELVDTIKVALADAETQDLPIVVADQAPEGTRSMSELLAEPPMQKPVSTVVDDMAFWLYSSGSTGSPKGTVHTHGNLYWTCETFGKNILKLSEEDVVFSAAKLFFAYGLGNGLSFPLAAGSTCVLMSGRPTSQAVFDVLKKHQVTVFCGVPTLYANMLADPKKPEAKDLALRISTSAGEALSKVVGENFKATYGSDIMDGLGSTEMLHIFLCNREGNIQYGTSGTPVPGYEISLRDDDGNEVAQGEIGDLFIKGPSTALMYWNDRTRSRRTFQGEWLRSGDKYVQTPEGYFQYCGRGDDMMKVSGQYVSPAEVEGALQQYESVLEAAVIGTPDKNGLLKTKAFIVLKEGYIGDENMEHALREYVKGMLTPHKAPRLFAFVEELPKTATGKIQRFRLREAEETDQAA